MTAHCSVEIEDVPDDILQGSIDYAMKVRGVPLGEVMQICREEALRQYRRERIVRIKAVISAWKAKKEPAELDQEQKDYLADIQKYGSDGWGGWQR